MVKLGPHHLGRRLAAKRRRRRHPVLARALTRRSDWDIDRALRRAALTRADLFRAPSAVARHRVRMAHMLNALGVDVGRAVTKHWQALKDADGRCARCAEVRRCRRWLQWGRVNGAYHVFCPNAALFTAIATE